MDFWTIVGIMLIIVPALWVASIIIQLALMFVIMTIGAIISGIIWVNKKIVGRP